MPVSTAKGHSALVIGGIQEDVRLLVPGVRVHGATEGARICLPAKEKNLARAASRTFGGGGLNVAFGLSGLGVSTTLVAAVGDDSSGDRAMRRLRNKKVTPVLARKKNQTTGLSIILHAEETDAILEDRGANNILEANDLTATLKKKYTLVFISHLSGAADDLLNGPAGIVQNAKADVLIWNPGTTQLAKGVRRYGGILRARPIVILNQTELMTWCEKKNPTAADYQYAAGQILRLGAQALAVTRGAHGVDLWADISSASNKGQPTLWHIPAVKTKVVDRLGGGDAFGSGFAGWFVRTENLCDAAIAGVINAAGTLTKTGATEGLLEWRELSTKVRAMTSLTNTR